MFRLRRYRLFLVVAILTVVTVHQLTTVRDWEAASVQSLKQFGLQKPDTTSTSSKAFTSTSTLALAAIQPTSLTLSSLKLSPPVQPSTLLDIPLLVSSASSLEQAQTLTKSSASGKVTSTSKSRPIESEEDLLAINPEQGEEFGQHGQGRLEVVGPQDPQMPKPHWASQKQHFPVATGDLIGLPTGKPKPIPKIQHEFADESSTSKADRERKLATIKDTFKHSWSGYTKNAMPHDELSPVSGEFRDPFNGWGATLVDTLDTLWMMGMKHEFEEAVSVVKNIDFTTSIRKDIPLFETVIRYLGGLIAAYDLSSGKYQVLLDKAVELAEILLGAFDTPNRMPVTFYYWAPSYASQPHRAGTRVVLAELGSLSVEMTRLAQITKDSRYYDAVARITNALETWQHNTTLPGLWPMHVDASGCKKPEPITVQFSHSVSKGTRILTDEPGQEAGSEKVTKPVAGHEAGTSPLDKRQLDDAAFSLDGEEPASRPGKAQPNAEDSETAKSSPVQGLKSDQIDCEPQGLAPPPQTLELTYSIGGMADSTYEYLPKEYMLLGGLNEQYQTMYEKAMDTVREELLFRPMTKTDRDILFVGKTTIRGDRAIGESDSHKTALLPKSIFDSSGSHLGCFAGGMFAVGAKIFGIENDLEIARKLTDGCIWAYESTNTGIMPETFEVVSCDSMTQCKWNETKWFEALDPHQKARQDQIARWNERERLLLLEEEAEEKAEKAALATLAHPKETIVPGSNSANSMINGGSDDFTPKPARRRTKRQVGEAEDMDAGSSVPPTKTSPDAVGTKEEPAAARPFLPLWTPQKALSHEEFVQTRIKEERLPPGFTTITSKKYILRPEAIESVFIMYRITGEEYWREKGWKMFTAIQTYTRTEMGNSAISDVTSEVPLLLDEMESFWLAETLKYFYLLYSDPSLISLDEYILNTEAHPFKRPK